MVTDVVGRHLGQPQLQGEVPMYAQPAWHAYKVQLWPLRRTNTGSTVVTH